MCREGTRIDVDLTPDVSVRSAGAWTHPWIDQEIDVDQNVFAIGATRRARLSSRRGLAGWCLVGWLLSPSGFAQPVVAGAADALHSALTDEALRGLVGEVLERNPEIARARRRAAATAVRAPQVKALPDPEATLTVFALPPETRVGPQRLKAGVSQQFPWFGKLALKERGALFAAAAAQAEVETLRLRLLTEARRLFYELSFLGEQAAVAAQEREHLTRHEEIARARYSVGLGLLQEVIKIQADITRSESQLLDIEMRRRTVLASLNALRDRTPATEVDGGALPRPRPQVPAFEELQRQSRQWRPELAAARAEIARREAMVELASKGFRPDFRAGISFTVVDPRRDPAGRRSPPASDGDDILELSAGANLPIWKRKLNGALEEALAKRSGAEEHRRQILTAIDREIGDAAARLPLLHRQRRLFQDVLLPQAEEAAKSSEAAYTTGKLNALALLHAHHVLFEVQIALSRSRADYAVALARLEGAVGGPIGKLETVEETSDGD